eukprot:TRINITY_DN2989_c0_g1_i1.p1 TRINITY_DN2989_c0_g1~~TRINITY_DN2989_c0_g1_i1.p1  ORF type:complete len:302 (-),score=19.73 TRINITY_DN2989_c0_g1_i1:523-1428(-)
MLLKPGDLIPVQPAATSIPWTRRKSQILNFLHRGPVTFSTLVYDTNVGDISALSTYFNPERVSVKDLNSRFGQYPDSPDYNREEEVRVGSDHVVKPRLLLYPEHNLNNTQVKAQRTLKWVLSQDDDSDNSRPNSSAEIHHGQRAMSVEESLSTRLSPPATAIEEFRPNSGFKEINPSGLRHPSSSGFSEMEFRHLSGSHSSSTENLSKGCSRVISRPGSAAGHSARTSPVRGQIYDQNLSMYDPRYLMNGASDNLNQLRAHTMPNLSYALDSVWRDLGSMPGEYPQVDRWPTSTWPQSMVN